MAFCRRRLKAGDVEKILKEEKTLSERFLS